MNVALVSVLAVPVLTIVLAVIQFGIYRGLVKVGWLSEGRVPPPPIMLMRSLIAVMLFGAVMFVGSAATTPKPTAVEPAAR